jgi:hypothetical protein
MVCVSAGGDNNHGRRHWHHHYIMTNILVLLLTVDGEYVRRFCGDGMMSIIIITLIVLIHPIHNTA